MTRYVHAGVCLKGNDEEEDEEECIQSDCDPALCLSREMLSIRFDMQRFKQNKKQLQYGISHLHVPICFIIINNWIDVLISHLFSIISH